MSKRYAIHVLGVCAALAVGVQAAPDPDSHDIAAHDAPAFESPGKPTAPIAIEHEWLEPPALGRDLRLEISIASPRALGDVTIRLRGRDGLVVDAASATTRVPALEPGVVHTFAPAVLAATPGTHYLAVSVTAVIDGAAQTRSVTIPVRLGGASAEPVEKAAPDAGAGDAGAAERVRSLPAEERVDARR